MYLYRPSKLKEDLSKEEVYQILKEKGYKNTHCSRCIVELIKKMNEEEELPHEIGLFLGYPPEDVKGFIENKASNCKCIGCWKVYGDEKKAQKTVTKAATKKAKIRFPVIRQKLVHIIY